MFSARLVLSAASVASTRPVEIVEAEEAAAAAAAAAAEIEEEDYDEAMGHIPSSVISQAVEDAGETGVLVLSNKGLAEIPTIGENERTFRKM